MHRFAEAGYKVRHDPEKVSSEYVVVNTCGFIGDAKEESIEMILQMVEAKKARKIRHLYVMGCLSQRYREELETEIPEVGCREFGHMVLRVGDGFFRIRGAAVPNAEVPAHGVIIGIRVNRDNPVRGILGRNRCRRGRLRPCVHHSAAQGCAQE